MGRTTGLIALALSAALAGGCGGTTRLLISTRSAPPPAPRGTYLAQMSAEQAQLAAAEKHVPTHPRTPAALSKSIALLASAVARLARGLAAIRPPPPVDAEHRKLVSIVRSYALQLTQAAKIAPRPNGELRAESLLVSATETASAAFSATVARINTALQRST